MPAYGQQVIPQEQNVPAPLIPKADDTVPNLIGQMGNAGLAAFVSINNHKNQVQLEEKVLQQRAIHDQQSFGLEREKMAQDFQLRSRAMNLSQAGSALKAREEKAYLDDTTGFANWLVKAPPHNDPGYAAYVAQGAAQFPLAVTTSQGQQFLYGAMGLHDKSKGVTQSVRQWEIANGIPPPSVMTERLKQINKEINVHLKNSAAQREVNVKAKRENVPYSQADALKTLEDQRDALMGSYGNKQESNRPVGDSFDTEEQARTAGHQTGDTIMLLDPSTNRYRKARLD